MRRMDDTGVRETNQEEGKDNAADEQPLADLEWDGNAAVELGAVVEDLIGPRFCGQHGHCGEDIGYVDEETLEDEDVEPEISVAALTGLRSFRPRFGAGARQRVRPGRC